ncbi:MAG TPA: hypothetical protein VMI53_05450 [Opitutaceae bacterium]|nr:hypothetical protein [Opitutaceae bacterium]
MKEDIAIDLSALALALAFRSIGYAVFAVVMGFVVFVIGNATGFNFPTDQQIWIIAVVIWSLLEIKIILRLQRLSRLKPQIRNGTHTLHGFELCCASFLALYSLALPYLTDSDASAYPDLKVFFELFIALLVITHSLVLVFLRKKPDRWDTLTFVASVIGVAVSLR